MPEQGAVSIDHIPNGVRQLFKKSLAILPVTIMKAQANDESEHIHWDSTWPICEEKSALLNDIFTVWIAEWPCATPSRPFVIDVLQDRGRNIGVLMHKIMVEDKWLIKDVSHMTENLRFANALSSRKKAEETIAQPPLFARLESQEFRVYRLYRRLFMRVLIDAILSSLAELREESESGTHSL